jgi:predicted dehydrogenase
MDQGSVIMTKPLRVGVVGLGGRWQRYRAALLGLRDDFEIAALCDASLVRVEAHARVLGCGRAGGVLDLLDRDDVEAVLLLDRLWWGLWPLEQACRRRKPALSCLGLAEEPAADLLIEELQGQGAPVLMAHPFAFAPALEQLYLLAEQLGPTSLIRAEVALPAAPRGRSDLLQRSAVAGAVAACLDLLGAPLDAVQAAVDDAGRLATLILEAGERLAEVSVWSGPKVMPCCRVEVVAAKGTAKATLPRRLHWQDGEDRYARLLPRRSAAEAALAHFVTAVREGQMPRPGIAEAVAVRTTLQAARQSQAEGRRIALGSQP